MSDTSESSEETPGEEAPPVLRSAPSGAFAYVEGHLIVHGTAAADRARELVARRDREATDSEEFGAWLLLSDVPDVLDVVEQLRAEGHVAQPDHVLWAHGCGGACPPHPAWAHALAANPFSANPFSANPFSANPFSANPFSANSFSANPFSANPFSANGVPRSSARPAPARSLPPRALTGPGSPPTIAIIDTGLADSAPAALGDEAGRITGDVDHPDQKVIDASGVTHDADRYLDPAAGHGTFIAGIIEQMAPGARMHVSSLVRPLGNADEWQVAKAIHGLTAGNDADRPDIILLALGGPVMEHPFVLRAAIAAASAAGIVVVASAGNSGTCVPHYPAALPNVIAVGAVGPDGPPPWTNFGDWVDACAPGLDLVSAFFAFDGAEPPVNGVDPDRFDGWARWSGTSFAAPVVVAALVREMVMGGCDARDAVDRVVRAPHLYRIPCLGTVVNL